MTDASASFGRYELCEKLGEGGMAEVFKARLPAAAGIDKVLVIKRILPLVSSDPEFIHLFVNEAKIALPLTHGNITSVFEFGEVEGQYFLAMEYIHGQDLAAVLHRSQQSGERPPVPAILFIGSEIAKGLNYAHSFTAPTGERVEVVHLDVSPQNVLVSYDGAVKLTDFGIASLHRRPSADGMIRGKACYLAPEQARGAEVDGRADIFALGTVLYEVLTGVRPFDAPDDLEAIAKVIKAEAPPPSTHRPELDPAVDEVVMRALRRDPAERYARAAELQVALSQLLFKLAPTYTAQDLAEYMRELFAWEIAEQLSEKQRGGMRDRLLFQLARAKIEVNAEQSSIDELLRMGTVSIPSHGAVDVPVAADGVPTRLVRKGGPPLGAGAAVAVSQVRRKRLLVGAAAGGAVLVALAAFALVGRGHGEAPAAAAPDGAPALVSSQPEDLVDFDEPDADAGEPATATTKGERHPAKAAGHRRRVGYLSCNSWPWSIVYLDRRRLPGNTPIVRARVPEGAHTLRFVNPDFGLQKEVPVTIAAGVEKTVAVKLDR